MGVECVAITTLKQSRDKGPGGFFCLSNDLVCYFNHSIVFYFVG